MEVEPTAARPAEGPRRSGPGRASASILRQVQVALWTAPGVLARMSGRSWALFFLYLVLCGGLLGLLVVLFDSQEKNLQRAAMSFLFPEEWHGLIDFLLAFVVKSQAQQVLVNVILFVTMTLVSLVFFWSKELLSQSIERDRQNQGDPHADPSRWRDNAIWWEGLEEIKWTLFSTALMLVVLWVGHDVAPWRKTLATVLSYLVLFFSTAVNFMAPPLQRRQKQYGQILAAMARRPVLTMVYGAAMALPQVLGLHLLGAADVPVSVALIAIFAVNVVFIAWSAASGTVAGLYLSELADAARPWPLWSRAILWVGTLGVLVFATWVAINLGVAIKDKSQILKCHYTVDWASVEVDKPGLGGLLKGEVEVGVSFEVEIDNPTELPVRIENNRLVAEDDGKVVAEGRLAPFEVPAGGKSRNRVGMNVKVRAGALLEGASLNPAAWGLVLYIQLTDDLEFPIPLAADT